MGLRAYIVKRTVYCFLLLIAIIIFDYILFVAMGNPTESLMPTVGPGTSKKEYEKYYQGIIQRWGLDQPWHVRIYRAVVNMLTFNFGKSFMTGMPVSKELAERLPFTILLLGTSTTIAIIVGVALGVVSASKRGSLFDTGSVTVSLVLYSLPVFWIGMLMILIFTFYLGWIPEPWHRWPSRWNTAGFPEAFNVSSYISGPSLNVVFNVNPKDTLELVWGYLSHLILPLITLTLFMYGGYLLLTRAVMIDVLTEDYIVTARAKGVPERTILYKHALKNASLPLITSIALSYAGIVSGAIITETVFSYGGVGYWIWQAILGYDYGVLLAAFFIMSACVIAANFIADLLYGIIDPRIKYG